VLSEVEADMAVFTLASQLRDVT